MSRKLRVMVLYGGKSSEHEISLISAASVIHHLDPDRFEVVPVAIDKDGTWFLNDWRLIDQSTQSLPVFKDAPRVLLPPHFEGREKGLIQLDKLQEKTSQVDVVFPVMHGTFCEDGTIQGLLELADLPYVGSGVLASAVGMDKDVSKRLARDGGIPIVPYILVKPDILRRDFEGLKKRVVSELGFPVFVKPANLGSSIGIHKVKEPAQLKSALEDAFRYDEKVLLEKAVSAREIEFAVLENLEAGHPPLVSQPGEIVPKHEFYSYEAKYLDEKGAELLIPARLDAAQVKVGQELARKVFDALECEGMGRVDFFLDRNTGEFYFNEVNTIPGFTSISMYPKMWEYSGISYRELLGRLIDLAVARHQKKKKLIRNRG